MRWVSEPDVAHQLSITYREVGRLHQRDTHFLGQEGVLEPSGVFQPADSSTTTGSSGARAGPLHAASPAASGLPGRRLRSSPAGAVRGDACSAAAGLTTAYPVPDGTRRLSSSTNHRPARSHTRSVPLTCARTACPRGGPVERKPGARSKSLHTDDAVGDNRLLGIDVAQERVQRPGPLTQAHTQLRPLVGVHHARHQVHREQLRPALAADAEGDIVGALLLLDASFPGSQLGRPEAGNGVEDRPITLPGMTVDVDRFVVAAGDVATGDADRGVRCGVDSRRAGSDRRLRPSRCSASGRRSRRSADRPTSVRRPRRRSARRCRAEDVPTISAFGSIR